MEEEQDSNLELTSTTAPGKRFGSRQELTAHYQSAWHRYNLQRRQHGLPVLLEQDFDIRWQAAQAMQNDKKVAKQDHVKRKAKSRTKQQAGDDNGGALAAAATRVSQGASAHDRIKQQNETIATDSASAANPAAECPAEQNASLNDGTLDVQSDRIDTQEVNVDDIEEDMPAEIDPCQSLFDRHVSASVAENAAYMQRRYGFFVPDREYLVDLEGLIGYCHEKIQIGHMCVYCHRVFPTVRGCVQHMLDKTHTKLCYEAGIDLEDLAIFYDFSVANAEFYGPRESAREDGGDDDGGDDGWEDVAEDEEELVDDEEMDGDGVDDDDDDSDEDLAAEVARFGLDVTPLGELVFPDGRVVGHRALRHYYKQQKSRGRRGTESDAVAAARQAAGERLYRGRVYNVGPTTASPSHAGQDRALALAAAGISPAGPQGRAGRGILVASNNGGGGAYTQLSIYRYRAALRKERLGEDHGRRVWQKSRHNMNKMGKKGNRLMNGVNVQMALR